MSATSYGHTGPITPSMLTIVTAYSNPILYSSRPRLYRAFEQHMKDSGVRLITIECALGERPFEVTDPNDPDDVQVRCDTLVWHKESLQNIGIQHARRTAPGTRYIGWFDGDITFRDADWAVKTIQALQHYDVVQPWSHCIDLGPAGEFVQVDYSLAFNWHTERSHWMRKKPYAFCHPGYAWAARASALETVGGLLECAALGAADHHMALALLGKVMDSVPKGLSPTYLAAIKAWQELALKLGKNFGYVRNTIEHGWHGAKADRRYVPRWDILVEEKYCPVTDIRRNLHGVIELALNKPELRHRIDRYFRQRAEDSNVMPGW